MTSIEIVMTNFEVIRRKAEVTPTETEADNGAGAEVEKAEKAAPVAEQPKPQGKADKVTKRPAKT